MNIVCIIACQCDNGGKAEKTVGDTCV